MQIRSMVLAALALSLFQAVSVAEVRVAVARNAGGSGFAFESVPAPAVDDAAAGAGFAKVDGVPDRNGGDLAVLHDGRVPAGEDEPRKNFFFAAGTDGGRIRIDLGEVLPVKRVGSYSWHVSTRAPQVYILYAADGTAAGFDAEPKKGVDPVSCGWRRVASVDTRAHGRADGGQHGVAITDTSGVIGTFRFLLFDIARTEDHDPFGNTFYSEIDVVDAGAAEPTPIEVAKPVALSFAADEGRFEFAVDVTEAPDLADWSEKKLKPVIQEWYPKLVAMLPSEGFAPQRKIVLRFRTDMGGTPASAGGAVIHLNARWFRRELSREALGAVVHEMVHVVQSYSGRGRRTPGWLVEGIADYIRWFLFEPETKGAEITKERLPAARYDGSYRVSANFLEWVAKHYDREIVPKLNAAAREGRYSDQLWQEWTGKSLPELGDEWREYHAARLNAG